MWLIFCNPFKPRPMESALMEVREGRMSCNAAAKGCPQNNTTILSEKMAEKTHSLMTGHGFMRHNPQLTERIPEWLTGGRAAVTEDRIRKWFADIEDYVVQEEKAGNVFQDPKRVFSFDESFFLLVKKKGTVLGPAGVQGK
ncbi:hypothetical protein EMCRGX_G020811 [Ephydatia muelleri]